MGDYDLMRIEGSRKEEWDVKRQAGIVSGTTNWVSVEFQTMALLPVISVSLVVIFASNVLVVVDAVSRWTANSGYGYDRCMIEM